MLNETQLESFQGDFDSVSALLSQFKSKVIADGISEYPIFISSNSVLPIGNPILNPEEYPHLNWFFYISTLEEFMKRKIMPKENAERFRRTFAQKDAQACVCLLNADSEPQFVFLPFAKAEQEES